MVTMEDTEPVGRVLPTDRVELIDVDREREPACGHPRFR